MKIRIYDEELEYILKKKNLIPRLLRDNVLKYKRKYYIRSIPGISYVENIDNIHSTYYYFIRYGSNMRGNLTYPINDTIYELNYDVDEIYKDDIINSNQSYYGDEIKYWFIKNNINLENSKYKGFCTYLNPNSKRVISDYKRYKVYYDKYAKQKCKIIMER